MTFKQLTLLAEDDFMSGMLEYEAKTKMIYEISYSVYAGACIVTVSVDSETNILDWVSVKETDLIKRAIKGLREKGEYEEIDAVTGHTSMFTYDREKAEHYYKLLKESAKEQGLEFEVYGDAI